MQRAVPLVLFVSIAFGSARPSVTERAPKGGELPAHPADGQSVEVNPPAFLWTRNEKAASYRLEVRRAKDSTPVLISREPLKSTVYPPYQKFEPGDYVWQVIYLDRDGAPAGASKPRRFTLPPGVPELLMPDVNAIADHLAGVRPRLFLKGKREALLKSAIARGGVPAWEKLRAAADAALDEPSYPEPDEHPPVNEWDEGGESYMPAKIASAHAARTALAYRLTGDPKYLAGARRWLLALAGWDPRGVTSYLVKFDKGTGHTEAAMPMLDRMSLAWDWIGDRLTADERRRVLASITERGNQLLRQMEQTDFLSVPVSNHSGRAIAFLGNAGIAFLGDIPDARKWLDYTLRAYLTSSPGYGGDDGGWAQGISYWSHYIYCHVNFAEALRIAIGVDLLKKPFFRHTGYFGLYFLPAYAPRGGFGDGGYHRPMESSGVLVGRLAAAHQDPVLQWHADALARTSEKNHAKWREWYTEDIYETLYAVPDATVKPEPPVRLDGSRHFPDVGWVAMHSDLGNADNDVWAMFKASRFGSSSHSHGDQNSFQLYAYGRSLAIEAGYHPGTSPHDMLYMRQTRSHNDILVNGRGQPPTLWEAAGEIQEYRSEGIVTVARGEAGGAYNVRQAPSVLKLWQKYFKEPIPPMEPKVESFERTLAFVGSKVRPVLVVHDYLKTSAPATFDWILHALNRMEIDENAGSILVHDGDARMAVRLITTVPARFSETGKFPIAPEAPTSTAYILTKDVYSDQWHFTASTLAPAQEVKFLAILVPYRASEPMPHIERLRESDSAVFRVGDMEIAAWWGEGARGEVHAKGLRGNGRFVLRVSEGGRPSTIVAQ
jgi:hypothetical protein